MQSIAHGREVAPRKPLQNKRKQYMRNDVVGCHYLLFAQAIARTPGEGDKVSSHIGVDIPHPALGHELKGLLVNRRVGVHQIG